MTPLIILSKEEIVSFESPPRFTAEERKYYFALPDWAEKLVATLTTLVSKTGFVLQLGYFRATNKFFPKSLFSPEDVAFVQKRLGITEIWQVSAYAETTMLRHMMHNTIVKADWFSTDTHGVTPLTFAAMHFLAVFFAPRIAGLEKRTRPSFVKRRVYQEKGYPLLPDALVNEAVMEENWDDMLRFMATILLRVTPASQLFQRLNSNARKHPLCQALSEFGRIIETIYILRNIDEVEIRQAGEKELNKMEHINKFSKAVFNEHNHVMQQETRELQLIADGCRRLIQNNIIGYNYLLLSQRVADTPEGKQREELLKQIQRSSMAVWHHIHMDGEYDFSDERVNTITPFHLSKILGLKIDLKQEE